MSTLLETIEIETAPNPSAAVIWLHGLGADGNDFAPIVPEIDLEGLAVRYVFPHAPMQPVTINGGMMMRAWYDISDQAIRREDAKGVTASRGHVEALIARERARGVEPSRIVIAGFSQGGAISLYAGLRHERRLAGIMALSCYLPLADTLAAEGTLANRDVPLLMCHGTGDPVVQYPRALESKKILEGLGYAVDWHEYRMPHSVCGEEIEDIATWLRKVLA